MGDANAGFLERTTGNRPIRPFPRPIRPAGGTAVEPSPPPSLGLVCKFLCSSRRCNVDANMETRVGECVCGGRFHVGARAQHSEQNFPFRYRSAASPRG